MVSTPKTVHVRYYAMVREQIGHETETRRTTARTAADLYEELRRDHRLRIPREKLKLAIRDEFKDWDTELADGDEVAFIPPVAGG